MGYLSQLSCLSRKHFHDKHGQELLRGIGYPMGSAQRGGNQVAGSKLPRVTVDVHGGTTTQDVIDLLGPLMGVSANRRSRRDHHVLDAVQMATQVHAIDQLFPKTHAVPPD